MDRFTRNYSIVLAVIGLIILINVFYESPGVASLNDRLAENETLAAYPYRFRVLALENGVATVSSPRSASFPAYRSLALLYPALRDQAPDAPAMMTAQQEMAQAQALARDIVMGSSKVERVVWKLDERWLRNNGVDPDLL